MGDIEIEEEVILSPLELDVGIINHKDLEGRDLSDQHPISAITNLQSTLDAKLTKDNIIAGDNITVTKEGNNITISGESASDVIKDVKVDGVSVVDTEKVANIDLADKANVDLDNLSETGENHFIKPTDYAASSASGVIKASDDYGTQGNATTGILSSSIKTYEQYTSGNSNMFISKGTMENAIVGKGLLSQSDIINDTSHTDITKPLSANMGKELQDEIDNLKSRGRFLSLWDSATGLPTTNPTTFPYIYQTGDYFIIGNIATGGCTHTITISGITPSSGGLLPEYDGKAFTVTFSFKNNVSTQYTSLSSIVEAIGVEQQLEANGNIDTTYTVYGVFSGVDEQTSEQMLALLDSYPLGQKMTILTETTATISNITDIVTGTVSSINYKPTGTSYTGVASTTIETETVTTDDVYYYDGTTWKLQINTQKVVSFANIAGQPSDNSNLASALNNKQDVISDLDTIRSGATLGASSVQPSDLTDYASKSDIPDVSNFITKTVNNLENYYLKTQLYNQDEIDKLIESIEKLTLKKVETLPEVGETNKIYLVPSAKTEEQNIYDEYIYIDSKWELIGTTKVDLSNYYTKEESDNRYLQSFTENDPVYTADKDNIVFKVVGKDLSTNDYSDTDKAKVDRISTTGDGTKYLSTDGTYKTVKTSELNNDSGFINNSYHDDTKANVSDVKTSIDGINTKIEGLEDIVYTKDIEKFLEKYFAMTPDNKVYTVRFPLWETSQSSVGEKLDDNAGLNCTPATDTVKEVSDYGEAWESIDCNAEVDSNGVRHITALKGMNSFRDTGRVDVFCLFRTYYQKIWEEDGYLYISRSFVPKDGYDIVPQAINKDGTINQFFTIGKYAVGDIFDENTSTHHLYSSKGLIPTHAFWSTSGDEEISDAISHTGCITLMHKKGNYYSAGTMADYMHILTTFYLKFATKNTQSIMYGHANNNYQYKVATTESNVHRVILTTAQANNFDLHTYVSVGDIGSNTSMDRSNGYIHNIAYDVEIIGKEVIDDSTTALILDHGNFDTTATTYVTTMHERSGYSDRILGRTGSVGSNTNGKHGMVLDGIEIMVGGYEVAGNAFMNIVDETGKREVYYTNDSSKLTTNITTAMATYNKSDLALQPTKLNSDNWITTMKFDTKNGLAITTEGGQSGSGNSTGYADPFYVDNGTSGQREFLLLGSLNHTSNAGLSHVSADNAVSSGHWSFLARLSINGVGGELSE